MHVTFEVVARVGCGQGTPRPGLTQPRPGSAVLVCIIQLVAARPALYNTSDGTPATAYVIMLIFGVQ